MTAGFGLEKLGYVALRWPRVVLLAIAAVMPLFVYFAAQLEHSSDIREIFRSESRGFAVLEEVASQYPASDRDIMMVVEGETLFTPEGLQALRNLHLEMNFVEDVKYVLSIFSTRQPPDSQGNTEPLFPNEITADTDLAALEKKVQAHPLVSKKLLSEDGTMTMVVIALQDKEREMAELEQTMNTVRDTANRMLEGSGLDYQMTGLAAIRLEIIGTLIRDQSRFAIAGLVIGLGLCWLLFRRWAYVFIAVTPAIAAIMLLTGGMAMVGQKVNVLTNIVPVIVMVIVFSDALHLLFGIRRSLSEGNAPKTAIAQAIEEVGPACVLTSVTTTIALLSLTLVQHDFISRFGLTAACGTAMAYVATMLVVPSMSAFLLARDGGGRSTALSGDMLSRGIEGLSAGAARLVRTRSYEIAAVGVLLTVLAGTLYSLNEPHYRYQENLPRDNPAYKTVKTIDARLAGSDTLRLLVQWPEEHELASRDTLDTVGAVHDILESEPGIQAVTSLHSVEQWIRQGGLSGRDVFTFLAKTDSPLNNRVVSRDHNSALLTAQIAGMDASELVPILDSIEMKLDRLRAEHPDVEFLVTGLVPLSARASYEMIGQLNRSLVIAIGIIIVLIGVSLRSALSGLVSIPPNLLPIAMGGSYLFLLDKGLQFTSVVAFTVGFGIAVDSTIHVLNRYRLARANNTEVNAALDETLTAIGPVLIVATLILVAGVAVTMVSALPMVQLYGQISVVILTTSLIGAMLFLPAILGVVDKWRRAWRAEDTAQDTQESGDGASAKQAR